MAGADHTLQDTIIAAWQTADRTTAFLLERLPSDLWRAPLPGTPRRTIQMLAGHLHNARCMWLRTLGVPQGLGSVRAVDRRTVTRRALLRALRSSGRGILDLLVLGCDHGGRIPATPAYRWRNLPLDVGHVLAYFVAHEAHHRGQIVLAARQLDLRLPTSVTGGLWQWTQRAAEVVTIA